MNDRFDILREIEEWEKEIVRLKSSNEDESDQIAEIKERINDLIIALEDAE